MAKGEHLSAYQQKVVRRFYEHADTRTLTALSELTSDLYLCGSEKQAEKLWKRVEGLLGKAGVAPSRLEKLTQSRDVTALAALVGELSGK